jgi:hypothetical protein
VREGDFFPVRGIEVWQMREWARTLRDVADRLVSPAELAELDHDLPRIGPDADDEEFTALSAELKERDRLSSLLGDSQDLRQMADHFNYLADIAERGL